MKISITNSAFRDLESVKEYYLEEGVPHIGDEFISAIIDHIQTLEQRRDIGRMVPEFNTSKIRELIHSPFRIVYLREKASIHVVRVWRSERMLVLPG
ncbi:MAG: type II toxin-antitoxin system RelE/ParE family toxin [Bacteroidetes bacterium]|nr:type II toxin-antitoxin system RelE/ParE family toxin [Bacteroidota bacterium]